jgi:hypothetical protein
MPVDPRVLEAIGNPTGGKLGDIAKTYVNARQIAIENKRAGAQAQIEKRLADAKLDESERDLLLTDSKILYAVTEQFKESARQNPIIAKDPKAYGAYMTKVTEGLPEEVISKLQGKMPQDLAIINENSRMMMNALGSAKDSKAPTKRTVVTRMDEDTGVAYKKDYLYEGNEVTYTSPEYADVEVTAETDLTSSQSGKELIDFQSATEASLNMMDVATEVVNAVRTSPESAGYSGNIISGVNEVVRTMDGLVTSIRPDIKSDVIEIGNGKNKVAVKKSELGDRYGEELSDFRNSAIWNEQLDSMLINLAYMAAAAKGQTGRGLSDKDLEMNMKEVGKTTDPIGVERVIRSFVKRTVGAYSNKAMVKGKDGSKYVDMVNKRLDKFDSMWGGENSDVSFSIDTDPDSLNDDQLPGYLEWLKQQSK